MTDSTSAASLARRVDELEAENAKLRAGTGGRVISGGRWRGIASAVAIVLASILLPLSIVGAWARVQLVDEDAFVAVFAPLIDEAAVQELIVDETMSAVNAKVDFGELTDDVFDGISELGLPPRASTALDLLRQPAAEGMRNLVESAVTKIVASETFSVVWSSSLHGAHRAFTLASTSDGGGIVVLTPDAVTIEVGPLIDNVKDTLAERGIGAAALIPTVERSIVVGDGQALVTMRTTYAIAAAFGAWMPVATLALFGLGIAVARRRGLAVLGSGIGVAVGGGLLGIALAVGASIVSGSAAGFGVAPDALAVIYGQVIGGIRTAAWTFFALGLVIAVAGWFVGGSTSARRVRAKAQEATAALRRTLPGN
ncbi:hypothetical protein ACTU6V_15030 [Microbacterium sp. A204]|uniref:hypothetical protein n=1 Tax=Microbacterium sp. A204 TaxID=3457321 RepID=UPI003FD41E08